MILAGNRAIPTAVASLRIPQLLGQTGEGKQPLHQCSICFTSFGFGFSSRTERQLGLYKAVQYLYFNNGFSKSESLGAAEAGYHPTTPGPSSLTSSWRDGRHAPGRARSRDPYLP